MQCLKLSTLRPQCPPWVIGGHFVVQSQGPLYSQEPTANISAYPLDPLSARGPRLERIAEVLGLTGNLPVSELHDTHRVGRQAVVCKNEFSDPKVGSTEYAPHHKALLVRLRKTRRLNLASTVDALAGLRVLKHCIVVVNLVLCLEIIRVRGCPVAIQSRSNVPVFIHCLLSHRSAGHTVYTQNGHSWAWDSFTAKM